jgi:hypothetical protein
MSRVFDLHEKWLNDPEYAKAYHALDKEFARAATAARNLVRRRRKFRNAADEER